MPLAPLLLALLPTSQDEPRVVERRFEAEIELASERFRVVGSEDEAREEKVLPPQVRTQADEIEIVDTLRSEEAGSEVFERFYRTVATSFEVGQKRGPQARTVNAGLEGRTVVFEREREGGWARRCDDPEVRPVQLKRLRAELDLAAFLPTEEGTEPDASWELPAELLGRVFAPVEAEVRRPRPKEEAQKSGLNLSPAALSVPLAALLAAPEGHLTATRLPDDEEEELPCRAKLEFRVTSTHDGSATILAGRAGEAQDELALLYQGTGTLAWDPASGAIELELEGEARLEETFSATIAGNGATAELEGELVLSGPLRFTASEQSGS
ncbi:MAG TPA: hypothetical protein VF530_12865 [Planctomycetota bacterium]